MKHDLGKVLLGIVRTLENEILPHVSDDAARGQTFSVVYVLRECILRDRDTGGDLMRRGLGEEFLSRLKMLAADQGLLPAPALETTALAATTVSPKVLCELLVWARSFGEAGLPLTRVIRDYMLVEIDRETKLTPKPMFAQIASGKRIPGED